MSVAKITEQNLFSLFENRCNVIHVYFVAILTRAVAFSNETNTFLVKKAAFIDHLIHRNLN